MNGMAATNFGQSAFHLPFSSMLISYIILVLKISMKIRSMVTEASMEKIRTAKLQDIPRIAEIMIFGKRVAYRREALRTIRL